MKNKTAVFAIFLVFIFILFFFVLLKKGTILVSLSNVGSGDISHVHLSICGRDFYFANILKNETKKIAYKVRCEGALNLRYLGSAGIEIRSGDFYVTDWPFTQEYSVAVDDAFNKVKYEGAHF